MVWTVKCDDTGTARESRYTFVTSASTTSFTPAANALLFLFISNNADIAASGVSGHDTGTGSQSWTELPTLQFNDGSGGSLVFGSAWVAMAPDSPSADTVDITWGSSARGVALCVEVNGHDTTETLANLIVQTDVVSSDVASTYTLTGSLAAMTAGNMLLSAGFSGSSEVQFAPVAPFSEVFETAGSGSYEIAVHNSETSDTTPAMDVTAVNEASGMIVLELLASGGGGGGSVHFSIDPRKRGRAVL